MKFMLIAMLATTLPQVSVAVPMAGVSSAGDVAHGGGCRKSSPPGQCCHAGSQPLHCH
ncbi:hypothetical protein MWU52_04700 [Jannaschia sp. S6380]|uniref:hypothetical protein n=1 Tax=Jannaschia sp. S6380 TaxID=2926408 RepID=UPI001FF32402|nr:hypothetical protein [Jannaschia sp. S6380]MCK0166844.1 hypothetical protein [Jannaschia sp. S6380]